MNAVSAAVVLLLRRRRRRERRWQVRPIFELRRSQGAYHNVFQFMKVRDPEKFFNFTRMSVLIFEHLLSLVGPRLKKEDLFREPICPEERLAITLRYLAAGDSMMSLSYLFLVSPASISIIIRETCLAIWELLSPAMFPVMTSDKWESIAQDFDRHWNFPNCAGAIDGKHIVMQAPPGSGSLYFNYKQEHSIVLLGISDAYYKFTAVNIGAYGAQCDSSVFNACSFGKAIIDGTIQLPQPKPPTASSLTLPYVFVADEAFPLRPNLMRPYPGRGTNALSIPNKIFNYRLSRARRVIENAFGVLSARWRILRHRIVGNDSLVECVALATVCLHNMLVSQDTNNYCPPSYVDQEVNGDIIQGAWRDGIELSGLRTGHTRNYSRQAYSVRDDYTKYFMNEGAVDWQMYAVSRTN